MHKQPLLDPYRDLVPWACVSLVVLAALLFGSPLAGIQLWPWLLSLLLFGLPHGACDHLVAARISGHRRTGRYLATFFLLYLLGSAAVISLWLASPPAALLFFLLLTAWHWGSADAVTFHRTFGWFAIRSASRGLLVVVAPLAFHTEASLAAFSMLTGLFETGALPLTGVSGFAALCVAGAVTLECLLIGRDLRRGRRASAARGAIEVALLLALMYFVSPVTAVGIYFLCWHAWRHVLRTETWLDTGAHRGVLGTIASYHLRALPLTLAGAAALAGLALAVGWESPQRLVNVYLILLSALTLPHALVVFAGDRYMIPGVSGTGDEP